MKTTTTSTAVCAVLVCAGSALAGFNPNNPNIRTNRYFFANVGTTYSAIVLPNDEIIGSPVVRVDVSPNLEVAPGSDASNFFTNLILPIIPAPGNFGGFGTDGPAQGWSGSGTFNFFESTDRYNGVGRTGGFGAETGGVQGALLPDTNIDVFYVVPAPGGAAILAMGGLSLTRRRR